jgi:hypothetical protein
VENGSANTPVNNCVVQPHPVRAVQEVMAVGELLTSMKIHEERRSPPKIKKNL